MKKLKLNESKLQLQKEKITSLTKEEQSQVNGGGPIILSVPCGTQTILTVTEFTKGDCDINTISHDDGPDCLSATDWGWCWCDGI